MQASNQLDGALEYLGKVGSDPVNQAELEEASGVGVEVTHEQLAATVSEVIRAEAELLREDRSDSLPFLRYISMSDFTVKARQVSATMHPDQAPACFGAQHMLRRTYMVHINVICNMRVQLIDWGLWQGGQSVPSGHLVASLSQNDMSSMWPGFLPAPPGCW